MDLAKEREVAGHFQREGEEIRRIETTSFSIAAGILVVAREVLQTWQEQEQGLFLSYPLIFYSIYSYDQHQALDVAIIDSIEISLGFFKFSVVV